MITTRGDIVTITASITFHKKDMQKENWEEMKSKLIARITPEYRAQITQVEATVEHEIEARERRKDR